MNESDKETLDQARTRRRWITLAELVAVAGVIIAALGFWNSWSERRDAQADRAASAQEAARKDRFVLKGSVAKDGDSVQLNGDDERTLGDVRVSFPKALGVAAQDALGHEIESDWFAKPILKLTDGGPDDRVGRLPVLVDYRYTDADGEHRASGLYDVIWETHGRRLFGRALKVTDFRLRRRDGTQAELDRLWTKP